MKQSKPDRVKARLGDLLAAFDGRSITVLGEAEAAMRGEPGYLDALIALIESEQRYVCEGATWLMKSALEAGGEISAAQQDAVVAALPNATSWAAQLHLCQVIGFIPLAPHNTGPMADWIIPLIGHARPFLRAWALDGLGHIARQDARFAEGFSAALEAGLCDEAASVRARARRLQAGN